MSSRATLAAFGVPPEAEGEVRAELPGVRFFPGVRAGDLHGCPPGTAMLLADGPVAAAHALGTTETLGCVRRGNRIFATGGAGLCRALELGHPGIRGLGGLYELLAPHLFVDLRWLMPELGHEGLALAELCAAYVERVGPAPASSEALERAMERALLREPAIVARARALRRSRVVAAARTMAAILVHRGEERDVRAP